MRTPAATRDVCGGVLLMITGVFVVVEGYSYDVGTVTAMGGGFFPVVLGAVMAALGAAISISALPLASFDFVQVDWASSLTSELRGFVAIVAGVLSFIVVAKFFGLAPAAFITVFISALGDRTSTLKGSAILALMMTFFAVGLFSYLLHVQIPIFKLPTSWAVL